MLLAVTITLRIIGIIYSRHFPTTIYCTINKNKNVDTKKV